MKKLFCIFVLTLIGSILAYGPHDYTNDGIYMPKNFLWGTAFAEYQNSGAHICKNSNWSAWEEKSTLDNPTIYQNQKSGIACDHWNRYHEDIQLIKNLGLNLCRLSVDWSVIEPKEGTFDINALDHYVNECSELLKQGIQPMITLHHFVHPQWFEEKGSFEKEENIQYFVRFCKEVFTALSDKVTFWLTINEPTIYAFQGYIRGVFPPGRKGFSGIVPTQLSAQVLRNLLYAHVEVYKALKAMPNGEKNQIGIVHQYLKFNHYTELLPLDRIPGLALNNFLNDSVLEFFKTKNYNYTFSIPFITQIKATYNASTEAKILDFIGINYYTQALICGFQPTFYPGQLMTDMPFGTYAQGLRDAIQECAPIGVPMYITESGIADADDTKRPHYFRSYFKELSLAIQDGYDVRGFCYWSLMDNFEWDMGYTKQFGLYKTNFVTLERIIRPSALYLQNLVAFARQGLLLPPPLSS